MAKPLKHVTRDIKDAEKPLRTAWPTILKKYREVTGNDLILTCVYRSVEEQQRLYAKGRTKPGNKVTWVDGVNKKSNHNIYPARAIDVAVIIGGKACWDEREYKPLGSIAKDLNLAWGGDWRVKDYPHIELPRGGL